ncbi:hypothetical protein OSB04_007075 [Centaurea solstitialis]|uniref:Uncharacterized protein n=1 Tax=Centaurea solstitialis TaxID=347529 RepID=A0AA38TJ72_9ASTR|nr:hypothetical protein OSB04_007075 [Centaurea solstitialis]
MPSFNNTYSSPLEDLPEDLLIDIETRNFNNTYMEVGVEIILSEEEAQLIGNLGARVDKHTPNLTPPNRIEDIPSIFVAQDAREPHNNPPSSQKDGGLIIKIHSPKGLPRLYRVACVGPLHQSEQPTLLPEGVEKAHGFFGLKHQRTPLGTSPKQGSRPSAGETNRMEVSSPEKEVRGSFRSPREVNITATSEGLLQSKSTEATCVGALESPRDYVTNEDFQNFATSVLHKLDELKSSTSRSTEAAPDTKVQEVLSQHIETLKAHTEALTKVTSAIDSLQTSISSLPSKVYVSDAINSVQVNSSFLDLLKTELAEIGKEYARDLAASRYINYNSFKTEIREIVDKAITIGVSPYQGHPKSLATRGDLRNTVAALGEEVRHTSAQFMYDNKLNMQI